MTKRNDSRERPFPVPAVERLASHLRDRYSVDATAVTKISQHNDGVYRVDQSSGDPWIARIHPPARPTGGVEGDAAILRFLEQHDYPAERLATADAVSDLDGASVLVTGFVDGGQLVDGREKMSMMGDLLGRLHALGVDETVSRLGGAAGDDPRWEGSPTRDLMAALSFLDSVDAKVAPSSRELFENLRERVHSAEAGEGLPEALLHGNLLHNPDHVLATDDGPVVINCMLPGAALA